MTFQLPEDLAALELDELAELRTQIDEAAAAIAETDEAELTDEQIDELVALADAADAISAESGAREAAAAERSAKVASARDRLKAVAPAEVEDEVEDEVEETPEAEAASAEIVVPDDASELVEQEEAVVASAAEKRAAIIRRAAKRTPAPKAPVEKEQEPMYSLTAAADVPGISAGAKFAGWDQVISAFGEKIQGFSEGTGRNNVLNSYPIAKLVKEPTESFISARASAEDVEKAIAAAHREYALPKTSEALVASGGWAAPSPILYDLPVIEEAPDGLLSLPTVTVERGGFQHTLGVDLSSVTSDSNRAFTQTETQAAAQTTKPFLTMGDVSFVDERLQVIGHGMRAGFLTLQGYPELVKRYVQLSNVAYIKYKNADLIARLLAATTFTSVTAGTIGSVSHDLIDQIALQARRLRYKYSLKKDHTFEGIAPIWLLDVIREDLAKRAGWDATMVPDAYIIGLIQSRGISLQFVRDYGQDLGNSATAYPSTAIVHLWNPGTFVAGGSQVVRFDALYDYDSIKVNTYTQFFTEESVLVAKMTSAEAVAITVSTAAAEREGRTGSHDLGSTHAS